jgi:hypothetical protein
VEFTNSRAEFFVKKWAEQLEDLPPKWYVLKDKGRSGGGGSSKRYMSVVYRETRTDKVFCLIKVDVFPDGTVEIHKDRRPHIREMLAVRELDVEQPIPRFDHETAVQKLRTIVESDLRDRPNCLLRIEPPNGFMARHKVDLLVFVQGPGGKEKKIPVVVKTSVAARKHYYSRLPAQKVTQIFALVIRADSQTEDIRAEFYRQIEARRNNGAFLD